MMFCFLSANDHATMYGVQQSMSATGTPTLNGRVSVAMEMETEMLDELVVADLGVLER